MFCVTDIDSLLDTLKSLSSNEEDEELRMLEEMLKSNTFKKAKQVKRGGSCVHLQETALITSLHLLFFSHIL